LTRVVSRGEIFKVDLEPTVGAEIYKPRPCVIIQENTGNVHSKLTIVAPITGYKGKKIYPCDVFITAKETGLPEDSVVKCNQIRTIDKSRLLYKMGRIPDQKMKLVDMALIFVLDLDYF
jgi:mRNA interferase MazF